MVKITPRRQIKMEEVTLKYIVLSILIENGMCIRVLEMQMMIMRCKRVARSYSLDR